MINAKLYALHSPCFYQGDYHCISLGSEITKRESYIANCMATFCADLSSKGTHTSRSWNIAVIWSCLAVLALIALELSRGGSDEADLRITTQHGEYDHCKEVGKLCAAPCAAPFVSTQRIPDVNFFNRGIH